MAGRLVVNTLNTDTVGAVLTTQNGMTGIAKAWVNFNGSTAAIRGSFNVGSVTKNGTGDYTITFTTAMANANYSVSGSAMYALGAVASTARWVTLNGLTTPSTTVVRISTAYANGGIDDNEYVCVTINGN
jgi:hypothetical protein